MGIGDKFDEMKHKAKEMLGSEEKAKDKVDTAEEKAHKASHGKGDEKIDKAADKSREGIDRLNQ